MNILSIDIGGTNTKYAVFEVRNDCKLLNNGYFKTPDNIDTFFELLLNNLQVNDFDMVAVGVPGAYNKDLDLIIYAPNLPLLNNINIKKSFSTVFNTDILVENDANLAALGEHFFVEKEGSNCFLLITLGTGIGGGIIYKNEIFGSSITSAEIGHITINFNGRKCGCGKTGCFEAYCGMAGFLETYREITGEKLNKVDDIFKKYKNKELLAKISVDLFSYHLASGLSSLANVLTPDKIKIGGGISLYHQYFFRKTVKFFSKMIFPAYKNYTTLAISELKNNAGIYGGAALCIKNR
ncbi:MAG: ROK family protein [Deferribacterales bacterium]